MSRLSEIKERAEKATAGPWTLGFGERQSNACTIYDKKEDGICLVYGLFSNQTLSQIEEYKEHPRIASALGNARFLVHSIEDIPYLLGLVGRMREAMENSPAPFDLIQRHKIQQLLKETDP